MHFDKNEVGSKWRMVWNGHIRNKWLQKIFNTRNIRMNFMHFKLEWVKL